MGGLKISPNNFKNLGTRKKWIFGKSKHILFIGRSGTQYTGFIRVKNVSLNSMLKTRTKGYPVLSFLPAVMSASNMKLKNIFCLVMIFKLVV